MNRARWGVSWSIVGKWLVYLGRPDGLHDVALPPDRKADAFLAGNAKALFDSLNTIVSCFDRYGVVTPVEIESARVTITNAMGDKKHERSGTHPHQASASALRGPTPSERMAAHQITTTNTAAESADRDVSNQRG